MRVKLTSPPSTLLPRRRGRGPLWGWRASTPRRGPARSGRAPAPAPSAGARGRACSWRRACPGGAAVSNPWASWMDRCMSVQLWWQTKEFKTTALTFPLALCSWCDFLWRWQSIRTTCVTSPRSAAAVGATRSSCRRCKLKYLTNKLLSTSFLRCALFKSGVFSFLFCLPGRQWCHSTSLNLNKMLKKIIWLIQFNLIFT